jgi:hypothetical protein
MFSDEVLDSFISVLDFFLTSTDLLGTWSG